MTYKLICDGCDKDISEMEDITSTLNHEKTNYHFCGIECIEQWITDNFEEDIDDL